MISSFDGTASLNFTFTLAVWPSDTGTLVHVVLILIDSSFSIPLTIVSELNPHLNGAKKKLLMSGFGVGLSWGTVITEFDNCTICELLEI